MINPRQNERPWIITYLPSNVKEVNGNNITDYLPGTRYLPSDKSQINIHLNSQGSSHHDQVSIITRSASKPGQHHNKVSVITRLASLYPGQPNLVIIIRLHQHDDQVTLLYSSSYLDQNTTQSGCILIESGCLDSLVASGAAP